MEREWREVDRKQQHYLVDTATGRVLGYVRILDRVNKLRERERPKEWQEFVAFVVHGDSVRYLKTLQSLQEARSVVEAALDS